MINFLKENWFKIRMIRLLFVFVFLLGLVSCAVDKKMSSSSHNEGNQSIKWSKKEKEKCLADRIKKMTEEDNPLPEIYQISKKKIAKCSCNKAEKKYESLNAAEKIEETPEFKESMIRAFIDCFDNSKKNNWSKEMMLLCETAFLQSTHEDPNVTACICEKLQSNYNNIFEAIKPSEQESSTEIIKKCWPQ